MTRFDDAHRDLESGNTRVRVRACRTLGKEGDRRNSVPRLAGVLAGAPADELLLEAASALARLGGRRAALPVAPLLRSHSDPWVRAQAAYVIGFSDDLR